MTIIESVRDYLRTYSGLSGGKLNVDFLSDSAASYSVDVVPCDPVIGTYLGGATKRQFLFIIATREPYGAEIRQQLDNLGFFESLESWINSNSKNGIFPSLEAGKDPYKLEVLTCGYAFAPDVKTARYQIQCRLEYMQTA